jgi:hypothetical protein
MSSLAHPNENEYSVAHATTHTPTQRVAGSLNLAAFKIMCP